jgi:hypothetical protein
MKLNWQRFDAQNVAEALLKRHCLYAFHHPDDGDRPFYIGKAKYFGPTKGRTSSARYNAGYQHLIVGLLRAGFSLYIAEVGEAAFEHAEEYEQWLIERWRPVRKQRIKASRRSLQTTKPWSTSKSALQLQQESASV